MLTYISVGFGSFWATPVSSYWIEHHNSVSKWEAFSVWMGHPVISKEASNYVTAQLE